MSFQDNTGLNVDDALGQMVTIDFSQAPISLIISYANITTSASWTWTFSQNYEWTLPIPPGSKGPVASHGEFNMSITLNKVRILDPSLGPLDC